MVGLADGRQRETVREKVQKPHLSLWWSTIKPPDVSGIIRTCNLVKAYVYDKKKPSIEVWSWFLVGLPKFIQIRTASGQGYGPVPESGFAVWSSGEPQSAFRTRWPSGWNSCSQGLGQVRFLSGVGINVSRALQAQSADPGYRWHPLKKASLCELGWKMANDQ